MNKKASTSEISPLPILAWEVEIDDKRCIVFATTKPKARWIAVRNFREAGYGRTDGWPSVTAGRAARYDKSSLRDREPKAWSEDYVRDMP